MSARRSKTPASEQPKRGIPVATVHDILRNGSQSGANRVSAKGSEMIAEHIEDFLSEMAAQAGAIVKLQKKQTVDASVIKHLLKTSYKCSGIKASSALDKTSRFIPIATVKRMFTKGQDIRVTEEALMMLANIATAKVVLLGQKAGKYAANAGVVTLRSKDIMAAMSE